MDRIVQVLSRAAWGRGPTRWRSGGAMVASLQMPHHLLARREQINTEISRVAVAGNPLWWRQRRRQKRPAQQAF